MLVARRRHREGLITPPGVPDSPGAIGDTTLDHSAVSLQAPLPGQQFGVPLPGGTSVSHVRVYDTVGPDGLAGGSPHLHTVCTEAYLVIAGEGLITRRRARLAPCDR